MFPFDIFSETKRINNLITEGSKNVLTDKGFLELEIAKWKTSPIRKAMITGEKYYSGEHDILKRKRTVIGQDGLLQEVENIPNNRIVDNQYSKMVDQKVNYLFGKAITIDTKNKAYQEALKAVFDKKFHRTIKNLGEDCLNGGIAWLHLYYNDNSELCFKKFEPYEILPFWSDAEHTILDFAVRLYEVDAYEGNKQTIIEKVEIYSTKGIERYVLSNGSLISDIENPSSNHVMIEDLKGEKQGFNWTKIPLIPFKYNNKETPLIMRVKSLQDGINQMLSDFENNMQEDSRNTILVIKNLDGTNLAEFRHNLSTYGAVKVRTIDGADGGVDTLTVEVNAENYKAILELFKKALIENARGYDAKDDRMSGSPNQMNIQSMYSDIDLDANGIETEFQASFEELLWFINVHLANTGVGSFEGVDVDIIFNRDILINESESIDNCQKSVGILSNKTIIAQHPWISDVDKELEQLQEDNQAAIEQYGSFNTTNPSQQNQGGDGVDEE